MLAIVGALTIGLALVAASVVVPALWLLHTDDRTLSRWSQIGQALEPIGVFFSGVAFIGIALTLFLQGRELQNQREELAITREEQQRSGEIAIRQLHTDLIKMAITDRELREVWPPIAPGTAETKKDHYCNLILNLQKVAYEARTIELAELRAALRYLMTSRDVYLFWQKARDARGAVTAGDEAEDFFTAEVDRAFVAANPPEPESLTTALRRAVAAWRAERVSRKPERRRR
jgi:predicted outer membrane lipoprotein